MSIQLVIVVVYIALLFGISLWVKHKADSGSTAFLLAGRKLNTILVAVNVTGLAVGAASTVGVAQRAFSVGLAAGWYNGAWSIGAIVMGLLAAGKLRSMKVSLFRNSLSSTMILKAVQSLLLVWLSLCALLLLCSTWQAVRFCPRCCRRFSPSMAV